ncbi:MAG: DNA polymerase I [Trueperaceae bacterium]|nr:DNA polymerase I [Trueperaceae bacterium]
MRTFYLIDGYAQLFRAYYAPFRPLSSPSGESVKAVYVFTQMLLAIVLKERPDYLAVAFDVSDETTERKAFYPQYKAHREAAPDDLHTQFARAVQVIEAMRVPIYRVDGQEADDLIATIAERLKGSDVELRIASKDKDLHQILSHQVALWDPSTGEVLDAERLWETKGYTPEQAVEIQTLVGDSTDNVPGVHGVGQKTALKLIDRYGTADAVLEHADEQTPKLRERLLEARDLLPVTRQLVTLRRDLDFEFDLERCRTPSVTKDDVREVFAELGFRSFLDGLPDGALAAEPAPADAVPLDYRLVDTKEALAELVALMRSERAIAVDTETTGLRPMDCDLCGLSFSWRAGSAWYVPVRSHVATSLDPVDTLEALRPVLEDPAIRKVGQNLKYDMSVLSCAGITLAGELFDTMIAASLLNPERRGVGMDDLARDLLGITTTPISAIIGKGKSQRSMLDVPMDELLAYAAEDADVTWRLYERLEGEIADAGDALARLFTEVEMPLVRVLASMEGAGVSLDVDLLHAYRETLLIRIDDLRSRVGEAAGFEFNLDSPKQLSEVLFTKLGLPVVKKTKTGFSTDAEVLETLASETAHPLPPLVLEYRELTKLLGTYVDPLPSYVSPRTGRLHASFNQTGAATGRLSSSDPNIQNIPIRSEAGREIRRAFVARDADHLLLAADYSQIELRFLAHFSEDDELLRAFREGLDIHTYVASQIFEMPLDAVGDEQRRVAKTVNFGIVYGQTAYGLARTLRIPASDAQAFIDAYKARYTGLERFLRACVEEAKTHGSVTTILGRRRPIPQVHSRNFNERALGERLAINTVIQGSAADMIKLAMVRLHERLEREAPESRLLIQVHDELVLETPRRDAERVRDLTIEEMAGAMTLRVPMKVDAVLARTWLAGDG